MSEIRDAETMRRFLKEVGGMMVPFTDIQKLTDLIQREFNPEKIILFGSHAWGTPNDDSDVDLLVILPYQKFWKQMRKEE